MKENVTTITKEATVTSLYEYPLLISGEKTKTQYKAIKLKNLAHEYSGFVTQEYEADDGIFVRFAFADIQLMELWKNSIKTI